MVQLQEDLWRPADGAELADVCFPQKGVWRVRGMERTGSMAAGLLELPEGDDSNTRILNGHCVEALLRRQPHWQELHWQELQLRCEARS